MKYTDLVLDLCDKYDTNITLIYFVYEALLGHPKHKTFFVNNCFFNNQLNEPI